MKNQGNAEDSREIEEKKKIAGLRKALKDNPRDPYLHYELGKILYRRWGSKESERGIKHLEQSVKFKKDFTEPLELLAVEFIETDRNKAIRLYRKAADIHRKKGNEKKADDLLNSAAMWVVYDGWEFLDAGDSMAAKKKAQRAMKIYPECVDARNILASIHMDRFEFEDAVRIYEEAISFAVAQQGGKIRIKNRNYWGDLDSRPYIRARHGLGLCFMHLRKYKEALGEFKTLLQLNPDDNQGIRFLLADVYYYMGDKKSAEKYYQKYGEQQGSYNFALLLYSKNKQKESLRLLKKSIKDFPLFALMLKSYLGMFNVWQERGFYTHGQSPALLMHRNALINAWNKHAETVKDYKTGYDLESAHDFCDLCGPLWLKEKGSYGLLLEGMGGIN
ncbi:cellulose synthase subunit BcsC [bacterium BMS3Abin07]|nr:cellulose synthase subunit BcsC [bacterium BMS3Abin07]GBE32186.1 cellulose synthase subunit BcsC [bacterium BMS3Bbin05]HDO22889.1 tetratricopeptide repeat protein [Nitrospirota bacterium]